MAAGGTLSSAGGLQGPTGGVALEFPFQGRPEVTMGLEGQRTRRTIWRPFSLTN
jgi:hypothetical protein